MFFCFFFSRGGGGGGGGAEGFFSTLEYVGRAVTVHNLCFNVHSAVEYLNRNDSIGQLPQYISKSIVVCARSRPKTKSREVFRAS